MLADGLRRAAKAHDRGEYREIRLGYEEYDSALPRDAAPEYRKLHVGLVFWDSWIDASNHEWRYHEPVKQSDWPRLAREIASTVERDEEIASPLIFERFDLSQSRDGVLQRLRNRLSGRQDQQAGHK